MACRLNEDNHSIFRLNLSLTDQMQGTKRVGDVEHGGYIYLSCGEGTVIDT